MTAEGLSIWLYGLRAASIEQRRKRMRLVYTNDALQKYAPGTPLLSLRLPLTPDPFPNGVVRAFLDGLLPEGDVRRAIAADLDVAASDTYTLIRELGRDCAGALVILPADAAPSNNPTTLTADPLSEAEIAQSMARLRTSPLGVSARVRLSLGGVQEKLVLTKMPDGRWGSPVDGTPSTHILKPDIAGYPSTGQNEAFCMRLASHLGLAAAKVETTVITGREVLVVERYDRIIHADGRVERIHQEDCCQALGIHPDKKYEEDGGPSLRTIARLLESAAGVASIEELLRATTLNVLLGNGDAHGKNFSLLHHPQGTIGLAPLYDLLSTLVYDQDHLAMYIDNVRRTSRVTARHLVDEAVSWGLNRQRATGVIEDVVNRAPSAAAAVAKEMPSLPAGMRTMFERQLAALGSSLSPD